MILDDLTAMARMDPEGMLDRIVEMPEQCRIAWEQVMAFDAPPAYGLAREVVILGMGGSAQGGDLLRSLAAVESRLPVLVNRQYTVPAFVSDRTVVIASSYSGNTEETLAALQTALDRAAMALVISTGGKVGLMAQERSLPHFRIRYESVPRAALAHTFVPALGVFQKLGFISDQAEGLAEAARVMEELQKAIGPQVPLADNPAKQLALQLHGKVPVVYGAGTMGVVARRWKGQLNENSKSWAFFEEMPELNHNAVLGTRLPAGFPSQTVVIMLTSKDDHPRNRLRYEVTQELLERDGVQVQVVEARGSSSLARMLTSIHFGDFVSFYLAMLNGANPTDTGAIEDLKKELARRG